MKNNRGIEINRKRAIKIWEKKAIFAYDFNQKVDWQINANYKHEKDKTPEEIIDECLNNDCVLFVEL